MGNKYKLKLALVDAEQWQPLVPRDDLKVQPTEIHYSLDKELFYITRGKCRPEMWLSTKATPGPVTEEERAKCNFFNNLAQFKNTLTGEVYHRQALAFRVWSVKSGPTEPIDESNDLFKDYAAISEWPGEPQPMAIMETRDGRKIVYPGDWIITNEDGSKGVCSAEEFDKLYAPA